MKSGTGTRGRGASQGWDASQAAGCGDVPAFKTKRILKWQISVFYLSAGNSVPVSTLDSHWHAVVQLQPGNVAESQHDACSVRPANALSKPLKVRLGALA